MNLLTSLALLGFVSRALAAQVVLLTELPEHLDQSSIPANGTRVNIHFGSANTSSISAILFPVEDIPSGATHLPGLSRRSDFGKPFGISPQRRSSNPRQHQPDMEVYARDQPVGSRRAHGNDDDIADRTLRHDDVRDSDVGGDYATSGGSESPSSPDDNSEGRSVDRNDDGKNINSDGRPKWISAEPGSRRSNDGTRRQSDVPGNTGGRRPAANDARRGEDDWEDDSSGRRGSNSQSNNRRRKPNESKNQEPYGSRRTPWGYPTSGRIPYPQAKFPAGKPFVKTTSEDDASLADSDQAASSGESFRNIYKNKPFPKPDYRAGGKLPSSSPSRPDQTIIVRPDGTIRESAYPPIFDSAQSSTGYEISTYDEETSEDNNRPQIIVVEADGDAFDTRSALSSSSAGDYETVIEIPAVIPAQSASSSESRSTILLKRPTTARDGYSTDTHGAIDIMEERNNVADRSTTAYIITHAPDPELRRPTVPTLIQLPGYKFSYSDSRMARRASN